MNRFRKIWLVLTDPGVEVVTPEDTAETLAEIERAACTANAMAREKTQASAAIAAEARDQLLWLAGQCEKAANRFGDADMRDRWV